MKKLILRFEDSWYLVRVEGIIHPHVYAYRITGEGKKHHKIHIQNITDRKNERFIEPKASKIRKGRKVIAYHVGHRDKPFYLGPETQADTRNLIKEVYRLKSFI